MKVNSTELQNNFGKYLMLATQEDIIITRNGTEIAKLTI
ncbi:type II toxin-antitoxin system Phd/YefM family antitoxin [Sutcliffiella sp. NC1]|nr:type II toxin-antitoxin system prevent-host-death family antitoxin [Sutcliffiella sp. NC1]WBL15791.1 type II toxin-antitoxin system prevent-host-death family antitoxin [Sutcliffiella sp. NC1]